MYEVSPSDSSGESEATDLEEEEVPNTTKVSKKGKNKLNRQNVQATRCSDTADTTGKLQTAMSDGKHKAVNVYMSSISLL